MRLLPWSLRHLVIRHKDAAIYIIIYSLHTTQAEFFDVAPSASTQWLSTPHRQLAKYSLVAFATPHRLGNRPWCTASPQHDGPRVVDSVNKGTASMRIRFCNINSGFCLNQKSVCPCFGPIQASDAYGIYQGGKYRTDRGYLKFLDMKQLFICMHAYVIIIQWYQTNLAHDM